MVGSAGIWGDSPPGTGRDSNGRPGRPQLDGSGNLRRWGKLELDTVNKCRVPLHLRDRCQILGVWNNCSRSSAPRNRGNAPQDRSPEEAESIGVNKEMTGLFRVGRFL